MSTAFIHFMDDYINIENIKYISSGKRSDFGWEIVIHFGHDESLVYAFDNVDYLREAEGNLIGALKVNGYILQNY